MTKEQILQAAEEYAESFQTGAFFVNIRKEAFLACWEWMQAAAAPVGEWIAPKMVPVFEFTSQQNWVNTAQSKFKPFGKFHTIICLDTNGNVCDIGEDFRIAEEKGLYPITAYQLIRTANAEPPKP